MNQTQIRELTNKYIKPEYQEEAQSLGQKLYQEYEAGKLNKIKALTYLPKLTKMIKDEYRDQAVQIAKDFLAGKHKN
ncbi:hypothetical protein AWM75_04900 [Aerococcus urinaehominis]|uniref:Uncharacterized protein n=1 Tax=Aerococcus urinaehominis TaxID=128944 RepID=A0A109RHZ3_9LACT|nr:hypothetical protein [Aerococcus urinaehominis]AMB99370.1 hypothetical protein AWM75_04900 [Aerococcus urinaehominis]SDM22686.1 hypothetical protein SAMN04487985_10924 [Aerococcus urinaehominis]